MVISVKHSFRTFLLCLFVIEIRGEENNDEGPQYIFEAEKAMVINNSCLRTYHIGNEFQEALFLATKDFLYDVQQGTAAYHPRANYDIKRQRCVKQISPDGNCLFRAISYCMYKTQDEYSSIRANIVKHVVENWADYTDFIVGSNIYERAIDSADEYEKYMSADRRWGAQVELMAATRVYDICLQVYTSKTSYQRMGDEKKKILALYYRGDGYFGHYSVVEDTPLPALAERTGFTIEKLNEAYEKFKAESPKKTHFWNTQPWTPPPSGYAPITTTSSSKSRIHLHWPRFLSKSSSPPKKMKTGLVAPLYSQPLPAIKV